ncbi:MAG: hypothetical protein JWR63_4367 [Conexibacter sp.]|nr:hypothetical protein [Conexibacter sp.]
MSHGLARTFLIVALLASALAGAASASANWTTNGTATGTAFTGTSSGTLTQLHIPGFGSGGGATCSNATMSGKLFGPSLATGNNIASVTPAFTTCRLLADTAAVKCGTTTVNALGFAPVTDITTMTVASLHCVIVTTTGACGNATTFAGGVTVWGSVPVTYGNTSQQLILPLAGQTLNAKWSSSACMVGTGTGTAVGTLKNTSGTALTYTITSTFKPQITN